MTTLDAKVMQRTSNFHGQVGKARLGITKYIFDNSTTFHASNAVFNQDTYARNDAIEPTIRQAQCFAFGLFFGWKVMMPGGSYP